MELKKVSIKNFKSIKNQSLEFGKVTTIIGKSEVGKSNLMRSLFQLISNPTISLEENIFHGENYFSLDAEFLDFSLSLERSLVSLKKKGTGISPGMNRYTFTQGTDKKVFDKVGRVVPDEIETILRMGEIDLSTDLKASLNYREQLSDIFLLKLSGTKKTEILSKISPTLITVSTALKSISTDEKSINSVCKSRLEPEIESLSREVLEVKKSLESLEVSKKFYEDIYTYAQSLTSSVSILKTYQTLLSEEERLFKDFETLNFNYSVVNYLSELLTLQSELTNYGKILNSLGELSFELDGYSKDINILDIYIDSLNSYLILTSYKNVLDEIELQSNNLKSLQSLFNLFDIDLLFNSMNSWKTFSLEYETASQDIILYKDKLDSLNASFVNNTSQYNSLLKEHGTCPVCGLSTKTVGE